MKNTRESYGNPGAGSGSEVIIPIGQSVPTARRVFPHILDAISQIQQFYVIESSGREIPDDFLTLRGQLNFFNVGFGAGFLEALFFALLLAITMIIVSDDHMRQAIAKVFSIINSDTFLWTINLIPVFISGGLCSYLSRFYIGKITRKSIDSLLIGRVSSLILKGLIIFFALIFFSAQLTPHSAWTIASWCTLKHNNHAAIKIYYVLMTMRPIMIQRAFEILVIFGLAITMPFAFIWGVALMRKIKTGMDRQRVEAA